MQQMVLRHPCFPDFRHFHHSLHVRRCPRTECSMFPSQKPLLPTHIMILSFHIHCTLRPSLNEIHDLRRKQMRVRYKYIIHQHVACTCVNKRTANLFIIDKRQENDLRKYQRTYLHQMRHALSGVLKNQRKKSECR